MYYGEVVDLTGDREIETETKGFIVLISAVVAWVIAAVVHTVISIKRSLKNK